MSRSFGGGAGSSRPDLVHAKLLSAGELKKLFALIRWSVPGSTFDRNSCAFSTSGSLTLMIWTLPCDVTRLPTPALHGTGCRAAPGDSRGRRGPRAGLGWNVGREFLGADFGARAPPQKKNRRWRADEDHQEKEEEEKEEEEEEEVEA